MTKRTTIYLDPKLHQAAKMKAVQTHATISDIVAEALRLSLKEDEMDLRAIKSRAKEPVRSYEAVLRDLKRDGLL